MKKIACLLLVFCAMFAHAQKVEILVGENWVELPAEQTQSEMKPGWKIVDYQMKSRLTRYLSGGRALQMTEGETAPCSVSRRARRRSSWTMPSSA